MIDTQITVFTSAGWGPCHMVKVYLSQRGIPFTEKNTSLDPAAKEELMKLGYQSTPITVIGDQKLLGFNPMRLQAALAAAGIKK